MNIDYNCLFRRQGVNEMNLLVALFTAIWWRVIMKDLNDSEILQKC